METVFYVSNAIPVGMTILIFFAYPVRSRYLAINMTIVTLCYGINIAGFGMYDVNLSLHQYKLMYFIGSLLQLVFGFFMCLILVGSRKDYEKQVYKYNELYEKYKELYATPL